MAERLKGADMNDLGSKSTDFIHEDHFLRRISNNIDRLRLLQYDEDVCRRLGKNKDASDIFKEASRLYSSVEAFCVHENAPPIIGFMGHFNSGKSSLINAILRHYGHTENEMDVGDHPTTKALHFITHRDNVRFIDGLTTLNHGLNVVIHKVDIDQLKGVILLDTPGSGEIDATLEWVVYGYLMLCSRLVHAISQMNPIDYTQLPLVKIYFKEIDFLQVYYTITFSDNFRYDHDSRTSSENFNSDRWVDFVSKEICTLHQVRDAVGSRKIISPESFFPVDNLRDYGIARVADSLCSVEADAHDVTKMFNGKLSVFDRRGYSLHQALSHIVKENIRRWNEDAKDSEKYASEYERGIRDDQKHIADIIFGNAVTDFLQMKENAQKNQPRPFVISGLWISTPDRRQDIGAAIEDVVEGLIYDVKLCVPTDDRILIDRGEYARQIGIYFDNNGPVDDPNLKQEFPTLRKTWGGELSPSLVDVDEKLRIAAKRIISNARTEISQIIEETNGRRSSLRDRVLKHETIGQAFLRIDAVKADMHKTCLHRLDFLGLFAQAVTHLGQYDISAEIDAADELVGSGAAFTQDEKITITQTIIDTAFSEIDRYRSDFEGARRSLHKDILDTPVVSHDVLPLMTQSVGGEAETLSVTIKGVLDRETQEASKREQYLAERLRGKVEDIVATAFSDNKISIASSRRKLRAIIALVSVAAIAVISNTLLAKFIYMLTNDEFIKGYSLNIIAGIAVSCALVYAAKFLIMLRGGGCQVIKYHDLKIKVDRLCEEYKVSDITSGDIGRVEGAVRDSVASSLKFNLCIVEGDDVDAVFSNIMNVRSRLNLIESDFRSQVSSFFMNSIGFWQKSAVVSERLGSIYYDLLKNRMEPSRGVVRSISDQLERIYKSIDDIGPWSSKPASK
jgi:predicted GTPase